MELPPLVPSLLNLFLPLLLRLVQIVKLLLEFSRLFLPLLSAPTRLIPFSPDGILQFLDLLPESGNLIFAILEPLLLLSQSRRRGLVLLARPFALRGQLLHALRRAPVLQHPLLEFLFQRPQLLLLFLKLCFGPVGLLDVSLDPLRQPLGLGLLIFRLGNQFLCVKHLGVVMFTEFEQEVMYLPQSLLFLLILPLVLVLVLQRKLGNGVIFSRLLVLCQGHAEHGSLEEELVPLFGRVVREEHLGLLLLQNRRRVVELNDEMSQNGLLLLERLLLLVDDLAGGVPDKVVRLRLALGRYVDHSLDDDGAAENLGLVGLLFAHVGQPHADLGLVAAVPDEGLHVGRPLGGRGVATQREHRGLNDGTLSGPVPARDVVDLVRLEVEVETRVVHEVPQLDAKDLARGLGDRGVRLARP